MKTKILVIDSECFGYKKYASFIKKIWFYRHSCQNVTFLDLLLATKLSKRGKSFHWVTEHLHRREWNAGLYDYSFLFTFFTSSKIRFPNALFEAKGGKKCSLLRSCVFQLGKLESFGCLKVCDFPQFDITICCYHIHFGHYFDNCTKKRHFVLPLATQLKTNKCHLSNPDDITFSYPSPKPPCTHDDINQATDTHRSAQQPIANNKRLHQQRSGRGFCSL